MKMQYWAGYTFGWPACWNAMAPWIHGAVVTPRYKHRLRRDKTKHRENTPVIIDNGAWPAYRKGEPLSREEQVDGIIKTVEELSEFEIRAAILPDVIGDPSASVKRALASIPELEQHLSSSQLFFVAQDGQNVEALAYEAENLGAGVFVGGQTHDFKFEFLASFRELSDTFVHIGRISAANHIQRAHELGANSFDNTTFMRNYAHNAETDYAARIAPYCTKRNS